MRKHSYFYMDVQRLVQCKAYGIVCSNGLITLYSGLYLHCYPDSVHIGNHTPNVSLSATCRTFSVWRKMERKIKTEDCDSLV